MEIWRAGGGVAASEWQERASYGRRGYPIYKRRPTPVFSKEMTRDDLESLARGLCVGRADAAYFRAILANVTRRLPKVRKIIVVNDPVGLLNACKDAEIPEPVFDAHAGRWELGNIVAHCPVASPRNSPFSDAPQRRYVWQDLAKRLAPAPAMGS